MDEYPLSFISFCPIVTSRLFLPLSSPSADVKQELVIAS